MLMAFLIAILAIGGQMAGGTGGMLLFGLIGLVFNLVSYWYSDRIALMAHRAQPVTREQLPELHEMVERLTRKAGLPMPRLFVIPSMTPNAFATGRNPEHSAVAVTEGILRLLSRRQLEGVIAHELSHIANKDVIVMTVAGFLATVAGLLVRMGIYSGMMGGNRGRDNSAAVFMIVILVSVVVYVLSFLLLRALSRYREYAADRGAAIMTGAPAQLASALQKISGSMSRIPTRDLRAAEGMNAFFIVPAVSRGFSLSSIVATHPPSEKRIERLMAMQAQIDASPAAVL
jgi:heat shock protein HtpX